MPRHPANSLVLFVVLALTSSCSLFAPTDDDLFGKQAGGESGGGESGGGGVSATTSGTGRAGGTSGTSKS